MKTGLRRRMCRFCYFPIVGIRGTTPSRHQRPSSNSPKSLRSNASRRGRSTGGVCPGLMRRFGGGGLHIRLDVAGALPDDLRVGEIALPPQEWESIIQVGAATRVCDRQETVHLGPHMLAFGRLASKLLIWLTAIAMPLQAGWARDCGCASTFRSELVTSPAPASLGCCCGVAAPKRTCCAAKASCCTASKSRQACCSDPAQACQPTGCQCGPSCRCG